MTTLEKFTSDFRLQQLRLLGLSEKTSRSLTGAISIRSYDAAAVAWTKGSKVEYWQLIISGLVASSVPTPNSKFSPTGIYGGGAWFGEQSIINRKSSYEDYVYLVPTDVMRMPAELVLELLETEAGFSRHLTKMMSWRLQQSSEMLMLMKFGNPAIRVVLGLAQIGEALTFGSERPPTIGFGAGVILPVKQEVLAALCGVSRTLFSEFIQKLAAAGWLRLSYGKLELCNLTAWLDLTRSQRSSSTANPNSSITELLAELGTSGSWRDSVSADWSPVRDMAAITMSA